MRFRSDLQEGSKFRGEGGGAGENPLKCMICARRNELRGPILKPPLEKWQIRKELRGRYSVWPHKLQQNC